MGCLFVSVQFHTLSGKDKATTDDMYSFNIADDYLLCDLYGLGVLLVSHLRTSPETKRVEIRLAGPLYVTSLPSILQTPKAGKLGLLLLWHRGPLYGLDLDPQFGCHTHSHSPRQRLVDNPWLSSKQTRKKNNGKKKQRRRRYNT
jgi:hypothetical protein